MDIEKAAVAAHEAYCLGMQHSGWIYGITWNQNRKTSPWLQSYDTLSEKAKKVMRDVARAAIAHLPTELEIANSAIARLTWYNKELADQAGNIAEQRDEAVCANDKSGAEVKRLRKAIEEHKFRIIRKYGEPYTQPADRELWKVLDPD